MWASTPTVGEGLRALPKKAMTYFGHRFSIMLIKCDTGYFFIKFSTVKSLFTKSSIDKLNVFEKFRRYVNDGKIFPD